MNEQDYSALKTELMAMIEFLQNRGMKVGEIREYLSSHVELPVQWAKIFVFFEDLQYSSTNVDLMNIIHKQLSTKTTNSLLYNNKLVKVIDVGGDDFATLLEHYQSTFTKEIGDYSISDLICETDETAVSFNLDFDKNKVAFVTKNIVNDYVRVDIEDRVDDSLKQEFTNIIGFKEVAFPALYAYIFDKKNHTITLSVDLANIIKSKLINMEMNNFSINLKKSVVGINFSSNSRNLFHKIDDFYKNIDGFAKYLSLKTPDGVIYHAQANQQYPDARTSQYHVNGALSVKGKVSVYRIQKSFNTHRNTQYSVDLQSIAAMTTKPYPVLYEATIMANNTEDFVDAIGKIL